MKSQKSLTPSHGGRNRRGVATLLASLAVIGVGLLASGCGSSSGSGGGGSDTSGTITIGAAVAETGYQAPFDKPPLQAMELAADKLNANGGIDGRKIDFVVRDIRSDTSQSSAAAKSVLDSGADILLVACDPDLAAPAATVGQNAGVLTFSLCQASTALGPQSIGDLVYTPSQAASLEGYVMAEFGFQDKGLKSAYMVKDVGTGGTYNIDVCDGFQKRFEELGGEMKGVGEVKQDDASIPATITEIKNADPDAIFICSFPPGEASWIRQIRAAGINQPILSDMSMDGTYWLKSAPDLSNFYYPSAGSILGDDPNPAVNSFVKEYTAKYGRPDTSYALFGPAVMELISTAIKRAGGSTDGAALTEQLSKFNKVPTLIGPTTYTPQIHIVLDRPMLVMQVQNGKPSYLKTWKIGEAPTLHG